MKSSSEINRSGNTLLGVAADTNLLDDLLDRVVHGDLQLGLEGRWGWGRRQAILRGNGARVGGELRCWAI